MNLLKENLRLYIPSIVKLIDKQDFPWAKIERKFNKKIEKRNEESDDKTINVQASIYDIIIASKRGKKEFDGLLNYFNTLFEELNLNLDQDSKKVIKTTVKNLLSSFDHRYLNFVGELSVLNNMIKSQMIDLIRCEKSIDNDKSIDFEVVFRENGMIVLIEVVNIHLNPEKTEDDYEKIELFLKNKLNDKRIKKTKDSSFESVVHIVPVLWGSQKDLKIYEKFYLNTKFNLPLTYEAMAYVTYSDSKEYYEHYFNPITKIFK